MLYNAPYFYFIIYTISCHDISIVSYYMPYHIIYHIKSCHVISYHIIYHIFILYYISYIISYHMSFHVMSYYISYYFIPYHIMLYAVELCESITGRYIFIMSQNTISPVHNMHCAIPGSFNY
jgi:hypothetical protein